jgi:3-phenylpropionate/trans-cinnamate dioxygenase ferredoxin reductase component
VTGFRRPEKIVVVGAGLAGAWTCVHLRRAGFTGELILVGAETHAPYDRPPLSKSVLDGRVQTTTLPLDLSGVDLRLGVRAIGLRPGTLETTDGPITFDGLAIATGAEAIRLPGDSTARVLRTIDDAHALRERLRPGSRLAVVGAGWIGAEVATSARKLGVEVTVVEAAATPLALALGTEIGERFVPWYAEAGVDLRLGVAVTEVRDDGLLLADGRHVAADEVVVGIGVRPDLRWLEGSGISYERGVLADEHLAVSWPAARAAGIPVVALGDCAAWWSRRYGARLLVEHWDSAQQAPEIAAATLLGAADGDLEAVYDPVPYFWSDQFGRMVQYAGHRSGAAGLVWRGDPTQPKGWSVGWVDENGLIVAIMAVGRPVDVVRGRKLLVAGTPIDAERFADPSVSLSSLVPT